MRSSALSAVLLLAACPSERTPAPAASPPAATAAPSAAPGWTAAQQACVDRDLTDHGLDAYGSRTGTMYTGGTPLFDETTGHSVTRQDFLAQHHPDVLRRCGL